jgi:dTDP-4-amino-4,6-dideoxygalactose transaminase
MSNTKIWLSSPHMGKQEKKYVKETFDTNWIAPLGPFVDRFEKDLCTFTGAKNAVALTSGTAAIHLALIKLGVTLGDEVICSTFTFSASCNPIVYQMATPILVDSETKTWNMSPKLLEKAIKDRISKGKKPKAIVLVHLYGMPSLMDKIMEISNRYDIPIVEDAAEALGSSYNDKMMGTFGKYGVLSFNGNKIITTSGGGALLCEEANDALKFRFWATQARDAAPHYQHSEIGYNYRLSNVSAAIGCGQVEVLAKRVKKRREIYNFYKNRYKNAAGVSFLSDPKGSVSNHWLSTVLIDPTKSKNGVTREDIRLALEKENIEARPLWKPMHLQPIFEQYPSYTDGTSESLFENGLCLPSGTNMSKEDMDRIVGVLDGLLL